MNDTSRHIVFRQAVRTALKKINVKLSRIELEIDEINDLNLLVRLEAVWPTLTQVKTFANFIKDDLGIGNGRSVVVVVDASDIVLDVLKMRFREIGGLYLVTTAKTFHEGLALAKYYTGVHSLAAVITDTFINSFDISTGEFEREISGIELIRQIKRYERYFDQNVYCIAMSSGYTGVVPTSERDLYRELINEAKQVADIYIPRRAMNSTLATLTKSRFGKG